MSVTITYSCDKCGTSVRQNDLFSVGVVISNLKANSEPLGFPMEQNRVQLCRACCTSMKIFTPSIPSPPPADARPQTAAERVFSILQDLITELKED